MPALTPRMHRPRGAATWAIPAPVAGWSAAMVALGLLAWLTWESAGWVAMSGLALAEFFLLKLAMLRAEGGATGLMRGIGFFAFHPGMNARAFLAPRRDPRGSATSPELAFALLKLTLGVGLAGGAIAHAHDTDTLLIAWIGMLGIIFTLHFGLLHVASWIWRRAGVDAPPIMRAPIAASSVAELWGARWNLAFADAARRLILRPLGRRIGVRAAGAGVFLISGLAHETVISIPAHGGWGRPTLYFLLQAAGLAVEKSRLGRAIGLGDGWIGRAWTVFVAVAPLPLLFHGPFAERVIVPLFRFLKEVL